MVKFTKFNQSETRDRLRYVEMNFQPHDESYCDIVVISFPKEKESDTIYIGWQRAGTTWWLTMSG